MNEPVKQTSWGIIRYAPNSGGFPEDDAAAFDGWYADRDEALAVAEDMVKRHPQWVVALVGSDLVWFGRGDFRVTEQHLSLDVNCDFKEAEERASMRRK